MRQAYPMTNNYREWTPVKNQDVAIELQKGRQVAVLIRLVDGELTYSAKRIDLLSRQELEAVVAGCKLAARHHARLAFEAALQCEERFGDTIEVAPDILDLAADDSSDKPQ